MSDMYVMEVKDHTRFIDNLADLFDSSLFEYVEAHNGDSYELATGLCKLMIDNGWLCSVITFANPDGDLKLFNEHKGEFYEENEHSVVCFGTWVIDPINSLLIFSFKEYVDVLRETNSNLYLVRDKSYWWNTNGSHASVKLKDMLKYKGLDYDNNGV